MPAFVVNALQRHRKDQRKRHMMLGTGKRATDDDYVFDRADGTPWNPNELSRQFSRLVRRKYIHPADEQRRLKARMLDGFLNGSNPAERTA